MRVGLDVDEVLAQLHTPWLAWGNAEFGTDALYFTHWNHPFDLWGLPGFDFLTSRPYERGVVLPYARTVSTVNALRRRGHTIHFVTATPDNDPSSILALEKFNWLEEHGFGPWVGQYHVMGNKREAPVDVLVDDNPVHCREFGADRSILMRRDHNAHTPLPADLYATIHDVSDLLSHFG